ncbi:MAG TPA: tRNA (adenosine(37)-N6)-dimethylallyltransferase MiaA [Acidisarcina sp.]
MACRAGVDVSTRMVAGLVAFVSNPDPATSQAKNETGVKDQLPLLVVLIGPTASGKTVLSLDIAERFSGEIISCDSVAVYRGMEIGAAKPSAAERARVPHHLIDIADPDQPCTAGDYGRLARAAIADISSRGRLPIVTGGTGLYLRALLNGLFAGPQRSEPLRERLRLSQAMHGGEWLHRLLRRIDPASAALIHANDQPKLIRAIEVTVAAGQPLSSAWRGGRDPLTGYSILRIALDPNRKALYERINARGAFMFDEGLVEETAGLLTRYPRALSLGSLGYRQATAHLRGEMTREEAIHAAQQGHRNYAKRQMTWFRREGDVVWLQGFGDQEAVRERALLLVAEAISSKSRNRPPGQSLEAPRLEVSG